MRRGVLLIERELEDPARRAACACSLLRVLELDVMIINLADGDERLARLSELGQSPVLGSDVRLDLAAGTTVLVGRNGAGKSVILERIHAALSHVTFASQSIDPLRVACEMALQAKLLRYECVWTARAAAEPEARGPSSLVALETCWSWRLVRS